MDAISAMYVPHNKNCGFRRIGPLFPRARASTENLEKEWKNISPDRPKGRPILPGSLQNEAWRHVQRRKKALDEHEAARNRARRVPDATVARNVAIPAAQISGIPPRVPPGTPPQDPPPGRLRGRVGKGLCSLVMCSVRMSRSVM